MAAAAQAIAAHRFRQGTPPATLEARVLYDADKLDAIGAIGVARAYAIAGVCGQRLWADVAPDYLANKLAAGPHAAHDLTAAHTPVHEMVFKLARLKDTLSTPTARAIAEERHRFMLEFFARLEQEVKGELLNPCEGSGTFARLPNYLALCAVCGILPLYLCTLVTPVTPDQASGRLAS